MTQILDEPSEKLQVKEKKNELGGVELKYYVQTFSLNKLTKLIDIFECSAKYFNIPKKEISSYCLTDTNFNDLSIMYD